MEARAPPMRSMEPGGKGVLHEIHKRRSPRRGAGNRRNQTGIKENKRKQKKIKRKRAYPVYSR